MERDYKVPKDFRKYNYVSQLLQRDGMQTAIEAHRQQQSHTAWGLCIGN
jgi:beta-mannosidase